MGIINLSEPHFPHLSKDLMPDLWVETRGRTGCPEFKRSGRVTLSDLSSLQPLASLPSDSSLTSPPTTPAYFQPHWPLCHSLNIPGMFLPQGLGTGCSPWLRSSAQVSTWLPVIPLPRLFSNTKGVLNSPSYQSHMSTPTSNSLSPISMPFDPIACH